MMRSWTKPRQFRLQLEWLLIVVIGVATIIYSHKSAWVQRLDGLMYDNVLKWQSSAPNPDIVIIEIDDKSLRELGAWPWARSEQAKLLDQLSNAHPKAVALDILFSEKHSDPQQDIELQNALQQLKSNGTAVYLPIAALNALEIDQPLKLSQPIKPLRQVVTGLGHIHVQLDADGIARQINLWEGRAQEDLWPSLSWQMYSTGKNSSLEAKRWQAQFDRIPMTRLDQWHTQAPILLPYGGGIGHYPSVSYVDVLRGEIPKNLLQDKYIFIGMTAIGVGDHYPTPVTAGESLMPGVQINATALDALLQDTWITPSTQRQIILPTLLFYLIWMLALWRMGPRASTPALLISIGGVLLVSTFLQMMGRFHWPSGMLMLSLLMSYVLWNWRRLSVLVLQIKTYAQKDTNQDLRSNPLQVPNTAGTMLRYDGWQPLLEALQTGLNQELGQKTLLFNTLQAMPEAVLLTDATGTIILANTRAHQLIHKQHLVGTNVIDDVHLFGSPSAMTWHEGMLRAQTSQGLEWMYTPQGLEQFTTDLFLRSHGIVQWSDITEQPKSKIRQHRPIDEIEPSTALVGWIVTLVDISWQKQLQNQRDQALQLLSHDFRAPQSALLALIRQRFETTQHQSEESTIWLKNLELQVQTSLKLADDFVWLLRAQDIQYKRQDIELSSLLQQVLDRAWPIANAKHIDLQPQVIEGLLPDIWIEAEGNLLERAFFNLVENAIKYSPEGTLVSMQLHQVNAAYCEIAIQDQGVGIAAEDIPSLFDRYSRFNQPNRKEAASGHGLGLALVRNVITQHDGSITCISQIGKGTRFLVKLPIKQI